MILVSIWRDSFRLIGSLLNAARSTLVSHLQNNDCICRKVKVEAHRGLVMLSAADFDSFKMSPNRPIWLRMIELRDLCVIYVCKEDADISMILWTDFKILVSFWQSFVPGWDRRTRGPVLPCFVCRKDDCRWGQVKVDKQARIGVL